MIMIFKTISFLFFCHILLAEPASRSEGIVGRTFFEISEDDAQRLNNPDGSSFKPYIPIGLRTKMSVRDRMTAVKNQGKRGTCNTFAAIGLIEFYERGDFSEQCLSYFSSEEDSGSADQRVKWASEHGLYRETDCPYDGRKEGRNSIPNLSQAEKVFIASDYEYYPQHRYNAFNKIRDFIQSDEPVVVDVYTAGAAWDESGIINLPTPDEINAACIGNIKGSGGKKCEKHSIIITGFDDNEEYFEFKNSWGKDWPYSGPLKGEGYGRISYAYFEKMKVSRAQMVSKYTVIR